MNSDSFIVPNKVLHAFAMIVDINAYSAMVLHSHGNSIAQFVRDVLQGSITAVEDEGGEVVGFMGDAILAICPTADSAALACFAIAKDLDRQCEYISGVQREASDAWDFSPGGPSLKIGIEYGWLDISSISSRHVGQQLFVAGDAINCAARIIREGSGNRCHVGRQAAARIGEHYQLDGPFSVAGKPGEGDFEFYKLDLGDIWIEGDSDETHW